MTRLHARFLSMMAILLLLAIPAVPSVAAEAAMQPAPEGDSGGAAGSEGLYSQIPRFIEIDFLGDRTRREISQDNRLLDPYLASKSDGSLTFALAKGTSFLAENHEPPARVVFTICPESLPISTNEYVIGDVYRIGAFAADGSAMGLDCSPEFELVFNYTTEAMREGTNGVHFARYDEVERSWDTTEPPAGSENMAWQVSTSSGRAGIYAVTASVSTRSAAPSPAHIEIRNLTISRDTVQTGQPVTVRAEAVNTGWAAGEQTTTLKASGSILQRTTLKLAPGQSRELDYLFTPTKPGEYDVSIGDAKGKLTAVGAAADSGAVSIRSIPLLWIEGRPEEWWPLPVAEAILILVSILLLSKLRNLRLAAASSIAAAGPARTETGSPAAAGTFAPVRPQVTTKLRRLVVEKIAGPTRRLKTAGPYRYEIKVVGGKPPYTIEWRGNSVTRKITDSEYVELLRDQTWDSGKGNWVFVMVRDSTGKYAEWVDEEGKTKRLFTYGVTRKGKIVTSPPRFPYDPPNREQHRT